MSGPGRLRASARCASGAVTRVVEGSSRLPGLRTAARLCPGHSAASAEEHFPFIGPCPLRAQILTTAESCFPRIFWGFSSSQT